MPLDDLLTKVSNPKGYGPLWYLIHKKAFNTKNLYEKEDFERFVIWLISVLLCDDCKEHATKYLKENPIRPFFSLRDERSGAEIGCFKWSWIFHNNVNRRLGKKELDWLTALSMYGSNEGCSNCGHEESKKKNKDIKVKKISGKYH